MHAADDLCFKSLLFTINDLLVSVVVADELFPPLMRECVPQDLTRLESGNELAFNEPFDLREAITDAIKLYRVEAGRRELTFDLLLSECPQRVVGDCKKIQTVVANLTGNACMLLARLASRSCSWLESEIHAGRLYQRGGARL
jgi:hypothetical protein